ncbi:MAG: DivIVA domain-containing protein [Cylindrospermopsis raciborskii]|jgi:cell division septum initiation protein DivIVA|uniref:DivIVA domain-containing protein n=1 Tax=Cylindrospermopsis raciborskii TaxID=77022 RepID=UPI0026EC97E3|nr:DivIVA domain-containing protein [Cylindrospermopsis raciborskii]
MLQPNPPVPEYSHPQRVVDILQELNRLEDIILSGIQIPFISRTLIDEDKFLEQLDFIRVSLPSIFQEAAEILQEKEEIILSAEEYAQQVIEAAQVKRSQILADNDIIRQVERETVQLRREAQQECDAIMRDTLAEIERKRRDCDQEMEETRQNAIAHAREIENGADEYADRVLENIEEDLQKMLRIVTNGRLQLGGETRKQRGSSDIPKE